MREQLNTNTIAVPGLRIALGLVVLLESVHFALSAAAGHHFARTGLAQWIRPALGWSEAVAALLFLVPVDRRERLRVACDLCHCDRDSFSGRRLRHWRLDRLRYRRSRLHHSS